jgi:GT2 family glycosyltransferase
MMSLEDLSVCVVVPLQCGPEPALRCLEGIAAQGEQPAFEVIVVDDAAPGLEPLLAQLAGDVTVLRNERRLGLAGSLSRALDHTRADTVAVLRDAAVPAPGWLSELCAALADPAVGTALSVTGGRPDTPALGSLAAAVPLAHVRAAGVPDVPDELVLGTLALSVAPIAGGAQVVASSSVAPARTRASELEPGTAAELTIVIPTLDATSARVQRCLQAVAAATDVAYEVVIVDNGAPPQGFSGPVNAGIRAADTPYIVVMNDDVEPEPGWFGPLRSALDAGAAVSFPLTVDGAMRSDFAAWCFALTRETVAEFGHADGEFFDPSLVIWFQDTDLYTRLCRAGRPPVLVRESTIRHGLSQTLSDPDPRLSAWVRTQVQVDQQRFEAKHPDAVLQAATLS